MRLGLPPSSFYTSVHCVGELGSYRPDTLIRFRRLALKVVQGVEKDGSRMIRTRSKDCERGV